MDNLLDIIQKQALSDAIRVTQHARQEMADEQITLDEVIAAIADGQIWKITQSINAEHVVCFMAVRIKGVLCISFVQQNSLCLLSLRCMCRSLQNG